MAHASPIKTARETANILQNHYPERLAIGFLFNPPKVFEAFFKVWTLHIPISQIYCMYPFYSYKIKASMRVHTEFFSLFYKLKCCKLFQVIKVFLDPKTIEKVNFVYQKDEESMKVLYKYIDPEVLPVEFGGNSDVIYNHEEYSELMIKDDIETANFWSDDAKTDHANPVTNGTMVPEVKPQPSVLAAKAS